MQNPSENPPIQQFRTVVMGYRLHGQLIKTTNDQQVFCLEVLSSSNKQEKYQIKFDITTISAYKFVDEFSKPKGLYDHVSKMTKLKVRFNTEQKVMTVVYEKQKKAHEVPIELLSINQCQVQAEIDKKEIETTFSEQKEQIFEEISSEKIEQKVQPTNNQMQQITEINLKDQIEQPKKSQYINPLAAEGVEAEEAPQTKEENKEEDKIEELRNFLQMATPKQQLLRSVREPKSINYVFEKSQSQPHTLYQYSLHFKVDSLTDIIESSLLDQTQSIVLKRSKLPQVPPFNQLLLTNLKFLSLEENKITKISHLDRMPLLEKLNLEANKISTIQNLSHLTHLKVLKLGNNDVNKISGVEQLISLQTLWLDFNNIQKIQGLHTLHKLKNLNLSFNLIRRIQNLESLSNLEQLLINENQLTKIQNLEKLEKLTKLSLSMNMIEKVRGLKKLLFLEVVHLNQNQIEQFDRTAFEEFNWLKMLKDVKLNANPIEWNEEANNYVQRLINYGAKVSI